MSEQKRPILGFCVDKCTEPVVLSELLYVAGTYGMTPDHFRDATPRQLAAMCRRFGWGVLAVKLEDADSAAVEVLADALESPESFAFIAEQGRLSVENRRRRAEADAELQRAAQKSTGTSRITIGL